MINESPKQRAARKERERIHNLSSENVFKSKDLTFEQFEEWVQNQRDEAYQNGIDDADDYYNG